MPKGRLLTSLLLLATCALLAAGCGGSGSTTGNSESTSDQEAAPSSPSLTTAVFVKKGDAVCAEGQKEVEAKYAAYLKKNKIKEIGGSGESQAEAEEHEIAVIETIALPSLSKELEGLKSLGTPSDDNGKVQEYLVAIEEGLEKGEKEPQLLFSSATKLFAKSDKLAKELGFKVCGNRKA